MCFLELAWPEEARVTMEKALATSVPPRWKSSESRPSSSPGPWEVHEICQQGVTAFGQLQVFSSLMWFRRTCIKVICTPRKFKQHSWCLCSICPQTISIIERKEKSFPIPASGFLKFPSILSYYALWPDREQPWGSHSHTPHQPSGIYIKVCLDLIPFQIWEPFGTLGSPESPIEVSRLDSHCREIIPSLVMIKLFQLDQCLIRH